MAVTIVECMETRDKSRIIILILKIALHSTNWNSLTKLNRATKDMECNLVLSQDDLDLVKVHRSRSKELETHFLSSVLKEASNTR
jgi:hypothetical protein